MQISKLEDVLLEKPSYARMRGSLNNSHAQTYSVFDNSDFKVAKEIYYEL